MQNKNQLTEPQRLKSLQLHFSLLEHASVCQGCRSKVCPIMIQCLQTLADHGIRIDGEGCVHNCDQCSRLNRLVQFHTNGYGPFQACSNPQCSVAFCQFHKNIREKRMEAAVALISLNTSF
jgi:hypothetical protein